MSATQAHGERALAFLARQRLAPTPQNYTLAYIALSEPTSPVAQAVNAITDGGVRIRQEEADEIVRLFARGANGAEPVATDARDRDALRHQTIKLGDMASSAAAATGAFSRPSTGPSCPSPRRRTWAQRPPGRFKSSPA